MATVTPYRVAAPADPDRRARSQAKTCHSLVVRIDGPLDPGTPRANLRAGAGKAPWLDGVRLWDETVAALPGDPVALARLRREAVRPLHATGTPLRAVLLTYRGGVADLVLVARRSEVGETALREIARLLLEGPETAVLEQDLRTEPVQSGTSVRPVTDWGLGDPSRAGHAAELPVELPETLRATDELLLAAVGLTLARYSGGESAAVGVLGDDVLVRSVTPEDTGTVADYVARWAIGDGDLVTGQPVPAVAVVFGSAEPGVRYRPFLAPVLPVIVHWRRLPDGTVSGSLAYDEGETAPGIARDFAAHLAHVVTQFAAGPDVVLGDVALMTPGETLAVLEKGRTPAVGDPAAAARTIHGLFAEVARRSPEAVALVSGTESLTYAELDEHAERIAAGLGSLGVTPGSLVGVALEPGAELVAVLLGVLKAGCAYVPMDLRYPEDRLRHTVEDAGATVVVGSAGFPEVDGVRVVAPAELLVSDVDRVFVPEDGSAAAYVIYTSGSTGRPKGVVVPHHNVAALVEATREDFALAADDVWTLFHSSAFDFSVWEIWGCLLTGARLVVVGYWVTRDTDLFHELLVEQRVTVLNQTPSAFGQLIEADRRLSGELALRLIVFGGEPLDVRMLAPWFARHSHTRCRLVNMFGITETTVHVTSQTVTPAEVVASSRSVGVALPGWSLSVRDPRGRVLPAGAPGEICVGGAGVADRYLGKPELTADRFVTDPHGGGRIYRSGDRGRLRPDGRLDHLGRLDNQVKVRGHRIELDEIRNVFLSHAAVAGAAAVLNHDTPGDAATARIDVFVVLRESTSDGSLLAHARGMLPAYMVPSSVTEVAAIPLTINGKVDVAALPAPGVRAKPVAAVAGPADTADSVEAGILKLWSHVLNTDVGDEDNFFELGGNSLLVIRVLREMRDQGLPKVSTKEFYQNSTAAQFVRLVRERSTVE